MAGANSYRYSAPIPSAESADACTAVDPIAAQKSAAAVPALTAQTFLFIAHRGCAL